MKIKELAELLNELVEEGYGEGRILFDTEGKTFDYHMAQIGGALVEFDPVQGGRYLHLWEKR